MKRKPTPYGYRWHGHPCVILVRPDYVKGHKRNALIKDLTTGRTIVVPMRAIRIATPTGQYRMERANP